MTHDTRRCDSCRSAAPCAEWEASKREPRATVILGGRECSLTESELHATRDRIRDALLELYRRTNR